MKINGEQKLLEQFERRGLLLVALAAIVLSFATISSAQSGAPSASSLVEKSAAAGTTTQTPNAVANSPATPANAAALAEGKLSAKGTQEGIKVHGHWTIEVRNPDGTVDKHVEFENGICPAQVFVKASPPNPGSYTLEGGAAFFTNVATGQASPGAWMIVLASSADAGTASVSCVSPASVYNQLATPTINPDIINILQSNASPGLIAGCQGANANCSATLNPPQLTLPPVGAAPPSISLSGQFQVPTTESGTVAIVSTVNNWCKDPTQVNSTPLCLASVGTSYFPTAAIVTGTQIPSPGVSYLGGQTIAVSVLISFQ